MPTLRMSQTVAATNKVGRGAWRVSKTTWIARLALRVFREMFRSTSDQRYAIHWRTSPALRSDCPQQPLSALPNTPHQAMTDQRVSRAGSSAVRLPLRPSWARTEMRSHWTEVATWQPYVAGAFSSSEAPKMITAARQRISDAIVRAYGLLRLGFQRLVVAGSTCWRKTGAPDPKQPVGNSRREPQFRSLWHVGLSDRLPNYVVIPPKRVASRQR